LSAQKWDSAAALVDSVERVRFRNRAIGLLLLVAEHQQELRRAMRGSGSGGLATPALDSMPSAALVTRYAAWRVRSYPGSPTIAELAALSSTEFLARAYAVNAMDCFLGECTSNSRPLPARVVGQVVENDSVAHVLYRRPAVDSSRTTSSNRWEVDVLHAFQHDGHWRVALPYQGPLPSFWSLIDESVGLQRPRPSPTGVKARRPEID
jgi:hypothetical protein